MPSTLISILLVLLYIEQSKAIPITYAIGIAADVNYFNRLMRQLTHLVDRTDSIIVQIDSDHADRSVNRIVEQYQRNHNDSMQVLHFPLNNDFSGFMNNMIAHSNHKGYMFRIDSDELFSPMLAANLKWYLHENKHADLIYVPRANYGTEQTHGYKVVYPDFQARIFSLENKDIRYQNRLHETVVGFKRSIYMPASFNGSMCFDIIHIKTNKKQLMANDLYPKIEKVMQAEEEARKRNKQKRKKTKSVLSSIRDAFL